MNIENTGNRQALSMDAPIVEIFSSRTELLNYTVTALGELTGQLLVLVGGNAETDDMLKLQSVTRRRIQAMARVPAQVDRPDITVATYTAANRTLTSPYGSRQLDLNRFMAVMLHDPQAVAHKTIRQTVELVSCVPALIGAVTPSKIQRIFLYDLYKDTKSGVPKLRSLTQQYDAKRWLGEQVRPSWEEGKACATVSTAPGGREYSAAYFAEVRDSYCPTCLVADSCLSAGLIYEATRARGSAPPAPGAWGGISSYARRELSLELRRHDRPSTAAFIVERARKLGC